MPHTDDIAIFIFIDALGWEIFSRHQFLSDLWETAGPQETILGYSCTCDPTILTGRMPCEHGHFSFFLNDEKASPFGLLKRLELLPSTLLEELIADANERVASRYRLTATVTRYEQQNFLFPSYFLPLSKLKGDEAAADPNASGLADDSEAGPDSSGTELAIPPEILEKLRSRRAGPAARREAPADPNGTPPRRRLGRVMVDRVGLIAASKAGPAFVPYAFGWDVNKGYYQLLPCQTLERMLARQAASPEAVRFSVAGLVTEFKGKNYLLLQRAIPVYSHGNFSP